MSISLFFSVINNTYTFVQICACIDLTISHIISPHGLFYILVVFLWSNIRWQYFVSYIDTCLTSRIAQQAIKIKINIYRITIGYIYSNIIVGVIWVRASISDESTSIPYERHIPLWDSPRLARHALNLQPGSEVRSRGYVHRYIDTSFQFLWNALRKRTMEGYIILHNNYPSKYCSLR